MKIIDLLNKIANGEEINKFKYYGGTYIYDKKTQKYWYEDMWFDLDFCNLNDEVEVIEDNKKIEKLEFLRSIEYGEEILTVPSDKMIINKINEIIDKLNEVLNDKN